MRPTVTEVADRALRSAASTVLASEPTPFLTLDVPALDRNLERMQRSLDGAGGPELWPHFKTHKCTWIVHRQLRHGAAGITCATAEEAAGLAAAGVERILLANVVADRPRLATLAAAARAAELTAVVDSAAAIALLDAAAREACATLGVAIELDVGMGRNGVEGVAQALELAHTVAACGPHLRVVGVQAYEGHLVAVPDRGEREEQVRAALAPARELCRVLRHQGLAHDPFLAGGATATYRVAANESPPTLLQAGTYALMDATYVQLAPEFEIAAALVCTVTTIRADGRIVVDAGAKRMGLDWGSPALLDRDAEFLKTSEEHSMFRLRGAVLPAVGDRVVLALGHICTTLGMHRHLYAIAADGGVERIEIDGRDRHA
jgi:D-serine deaminase-like pyridoxal phosphate-dependent protein